MSHDRYRMPSHGVDETAIGTKEAGEVCALLTTVGPDQIWRGTNDSADND